MKHSLVAIAASATILASAAFAADIKPDYVNDTKTFSCDNDHLTGDLAVLYSDSNDAVRVIYVKNASEIIRNADGLKCKATIVTSSKGHITGIVHYRTEEGHNIFGFKPEL